MRVKDKNFSVFLEEKIILQRVSQLAEEITIDYHDKNPLILSILNGAFVFTADLVRFLDFPLNISFTKLSSYQKMESSGKVKQLLGIEDNLKGRHILIVEDIVDTGKTLAFLKKELQRHQPATVEIATLLFKKEVFTEDYTVKYSGFEIPDKFVIGYGLDFDGAGRNYRDILQHQNE